MIKQLLFIMIAVSVFAVDLWAEEPAAVAASAVALIPETQVSNECSEKPGRPYKTYSAFGLGTDGVFYGVKSGQLKPINIPKQEPVVVQKDSGSLGSSLASPQFDYEKAKESIAAFKNANRISSELCADGVSGPIGADVAGSSRPDPDTTPTEGKRNRYPGGRGGVDCNVNGKADSYVLALSWQPAFCESKRSKPECTQPEFLKPDQYQSKNFTLHGLWPNKKDCGINYGFCNGVERKSSFAAYDPLVLKAETTSLLGKVMPSFRAKSFLERHEWNKHGTCQSRNEDDYFTYAASLVEQFNSLRVVTEVVRNGIGKKIKKSDFMNAIDKELGEGVSNHIVFICKKGMLVEVNIPLKKDLPTNPSLIDSINFEESGWVRGCGDEIIIDEP